MNLICITSSNVDSFKIIKFLNILPSFCAVRHRKWKKVTSRTDVFLKSQLFSKFTLNLARFDTKFVGVRKILLSAWWQGNWKVRFNSSLCIPHFYCPCRRSGSWSWSTKVEDFRGGSVAMNQCSLRKSTSMAQVFETIAFSIDFIGKNRWFK